LDAYKAYDAKMGPDLYVVAYNASFGTNIGPADKAERQIGKVEELALGYQGGVGSFVSMGKVYGLDPAKLVPAIQAAAPDVWLTNMGRYAGASDKRGLPQDQWAAVKTIVQNWRLSHPKLVQGWWDLQDAAVDAVANPGTVFWCYDGKAAYVSSAGFLLARLPSGRCLYYAAPRLVSVVEEWCVEASGVRHDREDHDDANWRLVVASTVAGGGDHKIRRRNRVDYDGYDGERKRWSQQSLYGGKQFNHIVQGMARDVMCGGMLRAEAAGYNIVLTVHDEVLDESPVGFGSGDELAAIMSEGEPWLAGCPLAAKGWEAQRYAK
jgi:DNA polymerase